MNYSFYFLSDLNRSKALLYLQSAELATRLQTAQVPQALLRFKQTLNGVNHIFGIEFVTVNTDLGISSLFEEIYCNLWELSI